MFPNAKVVEDTSKPAEVIAVLKKNRALENKVLLLIGGVGSGKSTFVDYLQHVALDSEQAQALVWARMDMNYAPVNATEIYVWLKRKIIDSARSSLQDLDFDDLDVMRKLYRVEIARFAKGVGKLYAADQLLYDAKLGEHLQEIQSDLNLVADAHMRFSCGERGKLCVVVLDNCDKKTRDEQLLMFEAAQWLQNTFKCLVILPLRDETFDNHRNIPPLDTVLKDMVFRIEPPLFQTVLMNRIKLALKEMGEESSAKLKFSLPNGFTVEYPKSDQAYYLTSIVKSLFENDMFARRVIVGLASRNMRLALEIFLEFCNSGYIGEDQIFKIRQSEGRYALPFHQIANVLLRMNRRYYDSEHSYIKNLFSSSTEDKYPTYFARYFILNWLKTNVKEVGRSGIPGYFSKRDLKQILIPIGFTSEVIDREMNVLLSAKCVTAEHLREDNIDDEDLAKISPAGHVHLELIQNVSYLAAIAEDTLFEDRSQAESVASRIRDPKNHLHVSSAVDNAREVISMLEKIYDDMSSTFQKYLENNSSLQMLNLAEIKKELDKFEHSYSDDPWFNADKKLRRGSHHDVIVTNSAPFGFFVEFRNGLVGLVHISEANGMSPGIGSKVKIEVVWVDKIRRRMSLKLIELLEEDANETD